MKEEQNCEGHPLSILKSYCCDLCDKIFTSKSRMRKHSTVVHCRAKQFSCVACAQACHTMTDLQNHMSLHNNENDFLFENFGRHLALVHDGGKRFACVECLERFSSLSKMTVHLSLHIRVKRHTCITCGEGFNKKSRMQKHVRDVHSNDGSSMSNKQAKCSDSQHAKKRNAVNDCAESVKETLNSIKQAFETEDHHVTATSCCLLSNKTSKSIKKQPQIDDMNRNSMPYTLCTYCEKQMVDSSDEKRRDEKRLICSYCEKAFNSDSQINNRVHDMHSDEDNIAKNNQMMSGEIRCKKRRKADVDCAGDVMKNQTDVNRKSKSLDFIRHDQSGKKLPLVDSHIAKPYCCALCGKRKRSLKKLTRHKRVHFTQFEKQIVNLSKDDGQHCSVKSTSVGDMEKTVKETKKLSKTKSTDSSSVTPCGHSRNSANYILDNVFDQDGETEPVFCFEFEGLQKQIIYSSEKQTSEHGHHRGLKRKTAKNREESVEKKTKAMKVNKTTADSSSVQPLELSSSSASNIRSNVSNDQCGKAFDEPSHMLQRADALQPSELPLICNNDKQICARHVTAKENELAVHSVEKPYNGDRIHHNRMIAGDTGEKPYICEHCGEEFSFESSMHQHVSNCCRSKTLENAGKTPYVCGDCGRKFKMKSHMEQHVRDFHHNNMVATDTGEKPCICGHCCKKFSRVSRMHKHVSNCHQGKTMKNAGKKPYICGDCGRKFKMKSDMKQHVRDFHRKNMVATVTGGKPFLCGHCGKKFSRVSRMHKHVSNCHQGKTMKNDTGRKPFVCGECGKKFNRESCMHQHANDAHRSKTIAADTGKQSVNCGQSGEEFSINDWQTVDNNIGQINSTKLHRQVWSTHQKDGCPMRALNTDRNAAGHCDDDAALDLPNRLLARTMSVLSNSCPAPSLSANELQLNEHAPRRVTVMENRLAANDASSNVGSSLLLYGCTTCGKRFSWLRQFNSHLLVHRDEEALHTGNRREKITLPVDSDIRQHIERMTVDPIRNPSASSSTVGGLGVEGSISLMTAELKVEKQDWDAYTPVPFSLSGNNIRASVKLEPVCENWQRNTGEFMPTVSGVAADDVTSACGVFSRQRTAGAGSTTVTSQSTAKGPPLASRTKTNESSDN